MWSSFLLVASFVVVIEVVTATTEVAARRTLVCLAVPSGSDSICVSRNAGSGSSSRSGSVSRLVIKALTAAAEALVVVMGS